MVSTNETCENTKKSCIEATDSKIKLAILDIKLWIVSSLVVFLLSAGSTMMCSIIRVGSLEQQIQQNSKNIDLLDNKVEYLRTQEIEKVKERIELIKEKLWRMEN